MVGFPNAKVNLGLFVTGKRPDGYHNLESVFVPLDLCDVLEIVPPTSSKFELISSGFPMSDSASANLVAKAFQLLKNRYSIPPVSTFLHKAIPLGAGLGGGSADAICMLRLLNNHYGLGISPSKLMELSSELGSDCPFFVQNIAALVKGRGEFIEEFALDLSGYWFLLLKPDLHISTSQAFSQIKPRETRFDWEKLNSIPISEWRHFLRNDFEVGIFRQHPELSIIKQAHYDNGALYAQMTGTGSCVYGLYASMPNVPDCAKGYWNWCGRALHDKSLA